MALHQQFIIVLVVYAMGCTSQSDNMEPSNITPSKIIDKILQNVDPRVRPNVEGDPVTIKVGFFIISFGSISEMDMDYSMDIYLRQIWSDDRMAFTGLNKAIILPHKAADQMWIPDLFFPNEKQASFHSVTVPNKQMKVFPNGTVFYSVRITLTLSCPMMLSHFPMDHQHCSLYMESYGHSCDDMILEWDGKNPIEIEDDLELPQFDLERHDIGICKRQYSTGNFPCLVAGFYLRRQYGFYVLQTYIPSVLIVILSWVSFWINMDAVPARISLGVTTVLTMATQLSGSRQSIPKVSYPKAIDVWMSVCMMFVFAALLEFAFVNVLARSEDGKDDRKPKEEVEMMTKDGQGKHTWRKFAEDRLCNMEWCLTRRDAGRMVDKISRIVFPLVFLFFNIVYWAVYTQPLTD